MKLLKISAFVLAGFLLGVLASYLAYLALPSRITEPTIPVVVASKDIPTGELLDGNDVHLEKVPVALVPPGAMGELSQVVQRNAAYPIAKGDFILPNKLAPDLSTRLLTEPHRQPAVHADRP